MMADAQTIILMIIGRTARLQLEIYPETGWRVMTCYSNHTVILNPHVHFQNKSKQVKTFLENSELFIAYAKMWSDVYRSNTS